MLDKWGLYFCSKHSLLMTRIQVSEPGPNVSLVQNINKSAHVIVYSNFMPVRNIVKNTPNRLYRSNCLFFAMS